MHLDSQSPAGTRSGKASLNAMPNGLHMQSSPDKGKPMPMVDVTAIDFAGSIQASGTSLTNSPMKNASPSKQSSQEVSPTPGSGPSSSNNRISSPTKSIVKDESVTPSLFGGRDSTASPVKAGSQKGEQDKGVEMVSTSPKTSPIRETHAQTAQGESQDLGYLFSVSSFLVCAVTSLTES